MRPDPDRKLTASRCQCSACGEYFNSDSPFDQHRIGKFGVDRRCMSADEMQAEGMIYKTMAGGQKWWVGETWEGHLQPEREVVKGGC